MVVPTSGQYAFNLKPSNDHGFLRGLYGTISPDHSYGGVFLERITMHVDEQGGFGYSTLILPGTDWPQGGANVTLEGIFTGTTSTSITFFGLSTDWFGVTGGQLTAWQWYYANSVFFIAETNYLLTIDWDKNA